MSHIVSIRTQVHDPLAVASACRRLGWPEPVQGTAKRFSGEASGWLVKLPGWQYPAVFDTLTGQAHYDNFGGAWGAQVQLDRFLQAYAVERIRLEARKKGHSVIEQSGTEGFIKLQIVEGA